MTHIKASVQTPSNTPVSASSNLPPVVSSHTNCAFSFPASGPLTIPMTNDYLFRALLQRNNKVLRGLICSLLHLASANVRSVEITNPIELGTSVNDKTFILDIRILLNDQTIINLELQVINQHNWVERSLSYLCRSFDNLQAGEEYQSVRPIIQIGLLNFTLFPEHPEFYATYQLLNVKNHSLYSDKLRLSVLDLTQIKLAAEEDKQYQIDYWASLFKATTWEELNMLAQNNEDFAEASATVYQLSQEERIRLECEAREDYYRTQLGIQHMLDRQNAQIETQATKIETQATKIQSQAAEIETQAVTIGALSEKNEFLTAEINKLRAWMEQHGHDPADI